MASPLTMAATTRHTASGNKNKRKTTAKSKKRARKQEEEELEERELTNLIFGSTTAKLDDTKFKEESPPPLEREEFSFQIDRTGMPSGDKPESVKNDESGSVDSTHDDDSDADTDEGDAPAWEDVDDIAVRLVDSNRLKKLRASRQETEAMSGIELENRLRKRYEESSQATARTDWARTGTPGQAGGEEDEQAAEATKLFSTSSSLLATGHSRLPPNVLSIVRCPDANQTDPTKSVVQALHFHPGSDPDEPLLLTAGLDKTLRFFQVGAERSEKIHGIHCKCCVYLSEAFTVLVSHIDK
jgi:U3 small nucleolar RNA-associated protein 18